MKNLKLLFVLFFWAFVITAIVMYTKGEWENGLESVKSWFKKSIYIELGYSNHLWFLKAIFVLNMLNPILYSFIHKNTKRVNYLAIILFLCTVQFFNRSVKQFINPMMGWPYAGSILYYVLGYAIYCNSFKLNSLKLWHIILAIVGFSFLQWFYNWTFLEGFLANINVEKGYLNDPVWDGYYAPFVVLLTTAVFLLFQKKSSWNNSLWLYIGSNSLPIYLMQSPLIILCKSLKVYNQLVEDCHPLRVMLPIVTLLLCVLLTWAFNKSKYAKWLLSI